MQFRACKHSTCHESSIELSTIKTEPSLREKLKPAMPVVVLGKFLAI